MMVKVKFEKDAIGPLHEHPHTQVSYVESGLFEVTIGDKKKIIKKGDGFLYFPSHNTRCGLHRSRFDSGCFFSVKK
jgi:quercetin dioxygenase-like cupin family protein